MLETNLVAPLRELSERGARVILVGGLAAVMQGAPIQTYDIDLVYARDRENLELLLDFLNSADATFRIQPHRRLPPNLSHLSGGGHLNLLTRWGPLDLLGTIGRNLGYEELISESLQMNLGEDLTIPVIDLETIILLKEELGGEKDIAVLPILRETLKELRRTQEID